MSTEPTRTADGRHIVVGGRRWRATDPTIPEPLRQQLVDELMAARRAVRAAGGDEGAVRAARARVQDAKVALGERGEPWWEPATPDGRAARVAAAVRALLRGRAPDATICPSEAARVCGGDEWRALLPVVRQEAAALADRGEVEVRQGGAAVAPDEARGPVRIGRGPVFPSPTGP